VVSADVGRRLLVITAGEERSTQRTRLAAQPEESRDSRRSDFDQFRIRRTIRGGKGGDRLIQGSNAWGNASKHRSGVEETLLDI
jgi:hypothetical protein